MSEHFASRRHWLAAAAFAVLGAGPLGALAQGASIGKPAPAFELVDIQGKLVKLADFKGRHVVLEWTNPNCPFVVKHYGSQNMQVLQKQARAKNVVWLSISSTAQSHADYQSPTELFAHYKQWGATPTAILMDDSGQVGRTYAARTTPHMYLIDPKGVLVYAGGIDDKRSASAEDVKTAKNFVRIALDESLAGKAVSTPSAAPYGCSIKYAEG